MMCEYHVYHHNIIYDGFLMMNIGKVIMVILLGQREDVKRGGAETDRVLVGGLEHFLFSHISGIIIPTDSHIFQRGSNHQPGIL